MKKNIVIRFGFLCITICMMAQNVLANESHSAYLEQFNMLTGNNFTTDYYLTREDFCVSVSKLFLKKTEAAELSSTELSSTALPFADAELLNEENLTYLLALYEEGILSGIEENGRMYMYPGLEISRQEAIALLGRLLAKSSENGMSFTDTASISPYAYGYIAWFAENGIISGYPDGSLNPEKPMTAGELAVLTIKTMDYNQEHAAAYGDTADGTSTGSEAQAEAGTNANVEAEAEAKKQTEIEIVAGAGIRGHVDDETETATFTLPYGVVCDSDGRITVLDTYNNAIRTVQSGEVLTLTGGSEDFDDSGFSQGSYSDDRLEEALLNRPTSGAFNSAGEFFFADSANNVIRHIKGEAVYTFSGTEEGFADGNRYTARFNMPMAIAIDSNDNIYVADTLNNCIRKIDNAGTVTTVAGNQHYEGYRDGAAAEALFRAPAGIAVNDDGSVLYISDTGNHMIRKIENGRVTTLAGNIEEMDGDDPLGGFENGTADKAMFNLPRGIIFIDDALIVADCGNNMVRVITESGNVDTVAGSGDPGDSSGSCMGDVFKNPSGLAYYGGELYIADTGNHKIKKMLFDLNIYK